MEIQHVTQWERFLLMC